MTDTARQRLRDTIALLQRYPEGMTTPELAAHLGVTRQTALDDINRLTHDGYPIQEDGKRYLLDPDYPAQVRLTLPQAWFMYLPLRRIVRANLHRFPLVRALLYRVASLLHDEIADQLVPEPAASAEAESDRLFIDLVTGWQRQQYVKLTYQRPNAERPTRLIVAPWWFEPAVWSDAFYLICGRERDDGSHEPLTLKLDRILSVELLASHFERPTGSEITRSIEQAWGIWVGEGVTIRLRFHNRQLTRLRETHWHPTQHMTLESDGSILWEATISEPQEMLPWIRAWGADVEVLEPADIREQMASEAEATARLYGKTPDDGGWFFS